MSGNGDEVSSHPAAFGNGLTGSPGQDAGDVGAGRPRPYHLEQIGPSTRPLSAAAGHAVDKDSTQPQLPLSSRDGSNAGDSSGASGLNAVGKDREVDGQNEGKVRRPGAALSVAEDEDADGICSGSGERPDTPVHVGNGHGGAQGAGDDEQGSRERERRRARARAREAAAGSSIDGAGGGDGLKGVNFGSPHSPPTPASS